MNGEGFVTHRELEEIKKELREMDKKQAILENDFLNFSAAFQNIMMKLELLPDKITAQLGEVIKREIETHRTACRLEDAENGNKDGVGADDKGFMQWVIKYQIQIMFFAILILATYFGVKLP